MINSHSLLVLPFFAATIEMVLELQDHFAAKIYEWRLSTEKQRRKWESSRPMFLLKEEFIAIFNS
jgi:hypothetical protein